MKIRECNGRVTSIELLVEFLREIEVCNTSTVTAIGHVPMSRSVRIEVALAVIHNMDAVKVLNAQVTSNGTERLSEIRLNLLLDGVLDLSGGVLDLGRDIVDELAEDIARAGRCSARGSFVDF